MYLDAEKGSATADRWLRAIHMLRDDLQDETRPMPLLALHDALIAFVDMTSRSAIAETARYTIAHDNLGFWVRAIRGARGPLDAFIRLDATQDEYGQTLHWESLEHGPSWWRGRLRMSHDPELERNGLLTAIRASALSAVPALFGFPIGRVVARAATTSAEEGLSQVYEVRWVVPRPATGAAIGGAGGAAVSSVVALFADVPATGGLAAAAAGAGIGAVMLLGFVRERLRRAETAAQTTRVQALERNLTLKEARERSATGQIEGSVVAGQYRIKERMASGATGVIYRAQRLRDGLLVALKLLRAAAAHDTTASDRLRREAEALGLAWHPNVVEVIDHGYLPDGTAYLVMELLDGETLATRLRSRKRLEAKELLPIAIQVCEALGAVHAAGVVHRDLKPSNIFLERARDGERVKILDFGVARVEWEETRITNIGAPIGTPGYMSPEQEVGGEIDARSDLFALGAVLYESLLGEPPPHAPSGMWLAGPNSPATAPRTKRIKEALDTLDEAWARVIERALAPLPRDRYQDARAFSQALHELEKPDAKEATS